MYGVVSVVDYGCCFIAVRALGTDRISAYEHSAIEYIADKTGWKWRKSPQGDNVDNGTGKLATASIWTQLALAYGIHKLLIFIRVPFTAAITPPVVKKLRSMGWNIGRPK